MNRFRPQAVLFDLDGTLLDTAPDLIAALNHVRSREDLPPLPSERLRSFVSHGAVGLLREGMPSADPEHMERRRQAFLAHYERHLLDSTRPFDGVPGLLDLLDEARIAWGVVTNKPEFLTWPILEGLAWADRAACVVCGDTLPNRKPHPEPVLHACKLSGVPPERSLMVGDDPRDLQSARAAGSAPVLAAYGYGAAEVLAGDDVIEYVVHSPSEIWAVVRAERDQAGS